MIDMKCPSCGAGGRIPKEKVNTRLVCKKCLRVFHVTSAGNTVLGEPAAPKDEHKPRTGPRVGPEGYGPEFRRAHVKTLQDSASRRSSR